MSKKITLMVVPEGSHNVFSRTISSTIFKVVLALLILWLIVMTVITIYFSKLTVMAARATMLEEENNNLRGYLSRVVEIEKSFKKNRELAARLAEMAGVDLENFEQPEGFVLDTVPSDSTTFPRSASVQPPVDYKIPISKEDLQKEIVPHGRPLYGWVTRSFSVDEKTGEKHLGFDFAVKNGTQVTSTASGVVTFAGWDDTFGNLVIIDHGNGYETVYGHNEKLLVEEGDSVLKGDAIALSGNTGRSSAPHLHYEIRKNGVAIDPAPYLD